MKRRKKYGYKKSACSLVRGGSAYFSLMEEMIRNARHCIHLQVYIFRNDSTGGTILKALREAAARGVSVYLLVDGYASQELPEKMFINKPHQAFYFKKFEPLLKSTRFYFGRRLHQKIFVCDGIRAMVGGVNIADHYNDLNDKPAWKDHALLIEGVTALELHQLCNSFWEPELHVPIPAQDDLHDPGMILPSLRIRRNDWVKGYHQVWWTYFNLFNQSRHSLTIMCSYFIPGAVMLRTLKKAAKRGVRIRIILSGPSDVPIAKKAECFLYSYLLRENIEIYEYQPSVLHAKIAASDHKWATIGSFNINNISALASLEVNVDIRSRMFVNQVQDELDAVIKNECIQVTEENFRTRFSWRLKVINRLSYWLIRIILNVSTFYFRKE